MKWRTDKPTADVIVACVWMSPAKEASNPCILRLAKKPYEHYYDDKCFEVPYGSIEKWADLEEDETETDCNELEEEIDRAIDDLEGVAEKDADGVLIAHLTLIEHLRDFARHFANWGAEHRDRFLNWIRDLIKKGIEKPEEALNILKRIDALINDDSLWGAEHLKK